jgi:hypothetical protein
VSRLAEGEHEMPEPKADGQRAQTEMQQGVQGNYMCERSRGAHLVADGVFAGSLAVDLRTQGHPMQAMSGRYLAAG